jgi:hypothetical protein
LNSPQTEEARKSIRPAYHGVTCKVATLPSKERPAAQNLFVLSFGKDHPDLVFLLRKPLITRLMDAVQKERRVREIAEVLTRFRIFAERSKWKKARISRELGVSVSTVDRWLAGQDKILLASMLAIRRFLEEWD